MNERYHAFVTRDFVPNSFFGDLVRLYVWREVPGISREYLRSDGNWQSVSEGAVPEAEIGLLLPAETVEAVATAIEAFQGHTSHADTEARVLREWLAVERGRVDQVLGK